MASPRGARAIRSGREARLTRISCESPARTAASRAPKEPRLVAWRASARKGRSKKTNEPRRGDGSSTGDARLVKSDFHSAAREPGGSTVAGRRQPIRHRLCRRSSRLRFRHQLILQRCQAPTAAVEDGGRAHSDSAIVAYRSLPLSWRRLNASWSYPMGAKWWSSRGLGKEVSGRLSHKQPLTGTVARFASATHFAVLTRIPKWRRMLLSQRGRGD